MQAKVRQQRKKQKQGRSRTPSTVPAKPALPDPNNLQVVIWPNEILAKPAQAVKNIDPWLLAVAEKMKQLMEENKGVGLAAPQVGLGLRMFVMAERNPFNSFFGSGLAPRF